MRLLPLCQINSGPVLRCVDLSIKYCVMAWTGQVDVPVAGIVCGTVNVLDYLIVNHRQSELITMSSTERSRSGLKLCKDEVVNSPPLKKP